VAESKTTVRPIYWRTNELAGRAIKQKVFFVFILFYFYFDTMLQKTKLVLFFKNGNKKICEKKLAYETNQTPTQYQITNLKINPTLNKSQRKNKFTIIKNVNHRM
jgi:hypothetical protein